MDKWDDYTTIRRTRGIFEPKNLTLEQMENMRRAYEMYERARRSYKVTVKPADLKIKTAIERVCAELPFRFTLKISEIRFGPDDVTDPGFEVVYVGGKTITFHNVDEFPTDADIGRILLECP